MDTSSTPKAAAASAGVPESLVPDPRRRLIVFLVLMTGMFMATLDNQIVATALPTIVGEFGALERFGWVGSAYLLASSAVMPIYGKLGDLFGRKYVIMAAVAIFTMGSLVCGLAVSMNTLIAARVLQALGGGGIMVSIFSVNADLFAPRERAKYQSYSSLVLMMSGAIGPVLGGTLSDLFGWRSIFLVNLPIGIAVLILLAILLPYRRPQRRPKIDFLGAALLAGAIATVVLWADSGQIFGSLVASGSLMTLALGALCATAWVFVERRAPEPVMPLSLFKSPTFSLMLVISIGSGAVGIGMVNYTALFLQTTTGLSPSLAGLMFVITTGGIAAGSLTAGRLISRSGRYKIFSIASTATMVLAMLLFSRLGAGTPIILIGAVMLFQGLGIGVGQQVPIIGVQNASRVGDVGAATGAVTLTRMAGASLGISIYNAIVSSGIAGSGLKIPGVESIEQLTPKALAGLPAEMQQKIAEVYAEAFHPMYLAAAALCGMAFLAALALKNTQLPTHKLDPTANAKVVPAK
ncbi:MDR family MFS transporter [Rhizobium halophytocola]|uniref:EmrB/QacA subfamily drug resistance transporter n=1 Tax=Rhizobium halophytocola TaxID=735519 RepID=A0ABS4DX13_9HYPH|nr:MDR family MFS transporter [Rhizobium halophytocola]MBP1850222.1 EmrB/QacA subfamily drug resistance transporter [Rhizobium halophytocola]